MVDVGVVLAFLFGLFCCIFWACYW